MFLDVKMCDKIILVLTLLLCSASARKHTVTFKDETRRQIILSSFGFVTGGDLFINFNLSINHMFIDDAPGKIGFSLDRALNNVDSPLLGEDQSCRLNKTARNSVNTSVVYFVIDFDKKRLVIDRSDDFKNLTITNDYPLSETSTAVSGRDRRSIDILSDSYLLASRRNRRRRESSNSTSLPSVSAANSTISATPVHISNVLDAPSCPGGLICAHSHDIYGVDAFFVQFKVWITRPQEEGAYHLIFHNCLGRKLEMAVTTEERNPGSYLSYGQQPLPTLFFVFCVVYIIVGNFWLWILCSSKESIFRIHYLMLALMYIKSLAMLFHGINYHFISVEGHQEEAFAVLYYIMYLVKGIFMFVTIVLIGAGWTFVKHVLSDRDKKIFVVIIPLQVLANVATVILEESDQGMSYYDMWKLIFRVIDLICCGAILFPVVWSIRHLQQASQIDGKAAINLQKLKIFRHFYILVVCYIYFTRIIVLLVQIAVRFELEWLDELLVELATLAFFILTGYKFRPASNNPYLQLSQSDDEEEMDEVLTRSGALESVTKVNTKTKLLTTEFNTSNEGIKQRESSHEYD